MLARVLALLEARPEMSQADFARLIDRDPSWVSEFLHGKRWNNDVRLLLKIAAALGVTAGYLLGEAGDRPLDEGAATLLATWDAEGPRGRELLLSLAASLRKFQPQNDAASAGLTAVPRAERGRKPPKVGAPLREKH